MTLSWICTVLVCRAFVPRWCNVVVGTVLIVPHREVSVDRGLRDELGAQEMSLM
jgi:hypothetical protein